MQILLAGLAVIAVLAALAAFIAYICFRMAFYATRKQPADSQEYPLPEGEVYEPYWPTMTRWMQETRQMPCREVAIRSFDGLVLRGRYYEYDPGAPIELMLHGYRSCSERDMCGGVQRCFKLGRSALIVDQRACGSSEGNVITFGVNESRDCLSWVEFLIETFGPDVKIILTGISMGAATVLMAAGRGVPKNVVGVLADCGYTSARDIIKAVIRRMKLPAGLAYPFVKLGAKLYGRFDLEELPPIEAVKVCKVPVIFFHGETDDYVPCEMSVRNYEACRSRKQLVSVPNAGHGLCYPADHQRYLGALELFFANL